MQPERQQTNKPSIPYQEGIRVDQVIHINRSCQDVYDAWRDIKRLPQIMHHLKSVTPLSGNQSHWVAEDFAGKAVEWDAEIITDIPGEQIAWRSLPHSAVGTAGSVHFTPTNQGTELKIALQYDPPGGIIGMGMAKLFGGSIENDIREDLRYFRDTMEAATAPNQPLPRS